MNPSRLFPTRIASAIVFLPLALQLFATSPLHAAALKALFDPKGPADVAADGITTTSALVTATRSQDPRTPGLLLTIQPGSGDYPGITLTPPSGKLDVSAYGYVDITFVNTGTEQLGMNLRLDNPGDWKDNPTNSTIIYVKPGESGTNRVYFGYNYGHPGYALNPAEINRMLVFSGKVSAVQTVRIVDWQAGGAPGEKPPVSAVSPDAQRLKPEGGVLFGAGVETDTSKQIAKESGGSGAFSTENGRTLLKVTLPAGKTDARAGLKTAVGRWDLRDDLEVKVKVRNAGSQAVTPQAQVVSNSGPTEWVKTSAPLEPGAEQEIVIPFIPTVPAQSLMKPGVRFGDIKPGTGTKFGSDAVSSVLVTADQGQSERVLVVELVTADVPPAPVLPDWLGQRPPVPGDWTMTLHDEFSGNGVDAAYWNIYAPNYWDPRSHFSKDDVLVGDGFATLRFEKKNGPQNDDPKEKRTDYATGYLDSFGKWTQRYGYFESRVKIPAAPGMWPAFWLMPDRGVAAGAQWQRGDTGKGGMEFDICEPLTRWGKFRYNIAMHYDGYGAEHKQLGSSYIYAQPDKDGFLVVGLLWTPGSAVYYANGKEVLRWEDPRISNVPANIIYTAVSGGWDNNAIDNAQLPADFVIDYVRVWQRKDLASSVDGKK